MSVSDSKRPVRLAGQGRQIFILEIRDSNSIRTTMKIYRTDRDGITFLEALTVLFIGLKLTHNIDWSWWLVAMPFIVEVLTAEFISDKYDEE